ncbi:inositol monophosphatase family protein [Solwaraspora sp. WMMD792]|uniref:inositol monophosphatase family protein n=1 Tax=Solwaraspora sp. WMMD792 TaxID=3016099 RepID=UPI0024169C21|nr:inositol monophosphatase family protein [Solwaraspora sp. WMMD792]MDG4774600.1 inositol monophosphatase family protein [Solwaraspora sp. WMMD792]
MIDEVGELLREAAARAVLPWFNQLSAEHITEKAPGDLVTVADQQAEEVIAAGLRRLAPGSVVVGEEAVAVDPRLLRRLGDAGRVWLVDPIDGTANYAAGRRPFVMMVALLAGGEPVASWILDPVAGSLVTAERGSGCWVDGVRLEQPSTMPPVGRLRGAVPLEYLPVPVRAAVEAGGDRVGAVLPGQHCAGREHWDIAAGEQDFAVFWRTLPWDHVPGTLLVRETGGVAMRLDGSPYDFTDDRSGLLVARTDAAWQEVRAALLPAE